MSALGLHNYQTSALRTKTCKGCGESKPLDDFYAQAARKDGRQSKCKDCVCAERRAENKRKADAKRLHEEQHPELRLARLIDRFWAKVVWNGDEDECWTWEGSKTHDGYGKFVNHGRLVYVHRFAYEFFVGPIPDGLQLDHLCRVRNCVNPTHLEPVTCRENLLRGDTIQARNAAKTHCLRGHPFDEENTYHYRGKRICWTCNRAAKGLGPRVAA